MKRRVISLVMVLVALCTLLTACGPKSTSEILTEALEKTEALDSVAAKMELRIDLLDTGMPWSIPITVDMKAKDLKSENPTLSTVISTTMFGQSMEIEMYQEDQWAYMVMDDTKYKAKVEDVQGQYDFAENIDDLLQELPDALLEAVTLVKNDDGSQTATIAVPGGQFADIYEDFIEGLDTGSGMDVSTVKISDAVVTITIANGYVTVYDMGFNMEMTAEGVTSNTEVTAKITFDNPGGAVEITPPEGYKDFTEQDLG